MKTIGWIATILLLMSFLYICSGVDTSINEDQMYMVVYEVECESCDIHYVNSTGGMSVVDNMKKWSEVVFVKGGTFVRVSAQNNKKAGHVSAKIRINENTLAFESCDGRYCIAAPSGVVKDTK